MVHYLLIWALEYQNHSFSGSAGFATLNECEEAKSELTKHKIFKREFDGYIKCVENKEGSLTVALK